MNETEIRERNQARTLAGMNFILGIWLVISPYLLSYTPGREEVNQTIFGAIIIILSAIRYIVPHIHWSSWLNALSGLWLIVAPFILSYTSAVSHWNEIIAGAVVMILALANLGTYTQHVTTHRTHPAM